MSKALNIKARENDFQFSAEAILGLDSFTEFKNVFPFYGQRLYKLLFERHGERIQTQKAKVAIVNLEKIFKTTFDISSVSGFDRMSLRDLSRESGMSLGAIYSCIQKKEDIAIMIADIVRLSSELTRNQAAQSDSSWLQIKQAIRFHLYASTLLQPWYFFLYFETRSLPETQQLESKQIELGAIASIKDQIDAGIVSGEFQKTDSEMVANTVVVLLEDWYLKPWKTQLLARSEAEREQSIDAYYHAIIKLLSKLLGV